VTDAIRAIYPEEGARLVSGWRERGVQTVESSDVIHGTAGASFHPILRYMGAW